MSSWKGSMQDFAKKTDRRDFRGKERNERKWRREDDEKKEELGRELQGIISQNMAKIGKKTIA